MKNLTLVIELHGCRLKLVSSFASINTGIFYVCSED